jgi:hypothetical protein
VSPQADDPNVPTSGNGLEQEVARRVAARLAAAEEQKWIGTVNTAIDAINLHVTTDQAHPRLLSMVERAVAATERMESMMMASAPADVARYLPSLLEREKRAEAERSEHAKDVRRMYRRITWAVPVATVALAALELILRLAGK